MSRRQALIETLLVFLVFFIQGAWPVPEVNEPCYLGKAMHFWNPELASSDFFLNTPDTHTVFYFTFGWLARWLPQVPLAWTLRLLTWGLLAWSWQRLSAAVVPQRWFAPLTAALFVFLLQHFNMAGEWVVGGVEAKGFAYVLVFLALEALVRGRWNRTWLLLGGASAFHVLVGGWAALAVGIAWLWEQRIGRPHPNPLPKGEGTVRSIAPSLRCMLPGLLGGFALALLGLVPLLVLDWGVDADVACKAHEIYVFERLSHHLDPWSLPAKVIVPFVLLCAAWFVLWRFASADEGRRRLRNFVNAALGIALAGVAVSMIQFWDRGLAADLLRFYWFRLADVAVPLGVALACGVAVSAATGAGGTPAPQNAGKMPVLRRVGLAALAVLAVLHLADCVVLRLLSAPPHAERVPDPQAWRTGVAWLLDPTSHKIFPRHARADRLPDDADWHEACDWIVRSGEIPADARFLVPRPSQTFRWYTHRGEVATLKELPQDAASIVQWWQRLEDIYATGQEPPNTRWYQSLEELGAARLKALGAKFEADYAITQRLRVWDPEAETWGHAQPPLPLDSVYMNDSYIIYRLRRRSSTQDLRPKTKDPSACVP